MSPEGGGGADELLLGVHAVQEALRAGRRGIRRLLVSRDRRPPRMAALVDAAAKRGIRVEWAPRDELTALAQTGRHQGVVAVAGGYPWATAEALLDQVAGRGMPLLLVADGIEDPQNLGAILRTAEAAGVDGVVIPRHRAAGISGAVARVSCGALEYLRVAGATNIPAFLERAKSAGFWVVGADPGGSKSLYDIDWRVPVALVLGGEDRGLRPLVRRRCDIVATIPMRGRVASLNVSAAAAIFLFEILRARNSEIIREKL